MPSYRRRIRQPIIPSPMFKDAIAAIFMELRASDDKLDKDIDKSMGKARKRLNAHGKQLMAAGTAAVVGFTAAVSLAYNNGAERIDKLAKTSDKIGIATDALTSLHLSAQLSGVSIGTMDMALQRMTRRVAEAAGGSGEAVNALKELGLSAKHLATLSPDQQLYAIADAMQGVEGQSNRVRLAMKLFDSEGVALVNTLAGGSQALREQAKEAEALGLTISRIDAAKVEQANDAMLKAGAATEAITNSLTVELAPIVAGVAQEFVGVTKETNGWRNAIRGAIDVGATGVGYMLDAYAALKMAGLSVNYVLVEMGKAGVVSFEKMLEASAGINLMWADAKQGGIDMINGLIDGTEKGTNALLAFVHDGVVGSLMLLSDKAEQFINNIIDSASEVKQFFGGDAIERVSFGKELANSKAPSIDLQGFKIGDAVAADNSLIESYLPKVQEAHEFLTGVSQNIVEDINAQVQSAIPSEELQAKVAKWRADSEKSAQAAADAAKERQNSLEGSTSQLDKMAEATKKATKATKKLTDAEKEAKRQAEDAARHWEYATDRFSDVIGDTFIDGLTGARSFKDGVLDMIKDLGQAWLKSAFHQAMFGQQGGHTNNSVLGGLMGAFGGMQSTGQGGGIGGILGAASSFLGGFFAEGGRPPMGKVSVVGEQGPELFVPDRPGTIIPNHALAPAGNGGAPSITVNQNFSAGVTHKELASILPQVKSETLQAVVEAVTRGGSFRKAMQS